MAQSSRWLVRLGALVVLAAAVAIAAVFAVPRYARSRIEQALGPHAHVDAFLLETAQLVLLGVRIDKPRTSWPAETQLRVERATVDLSVADLLATPHRIPRLRLAGLHIVIVRSKDGSTHALPDLTEAQRREPGAESSGIELRIGILELRAVTVELVDEALQQRAVIELGAPSTMNPAVDQTRFAPYWAEAGLSPELGRSLATALGVRVTSVDQVVFEPRRRVD